MKNSEICVRAFRRAALLKGLRVVLLPQSEPPQGNSNSKISNEPFLKYRRWDGSFIDFI